MTMQAREHKPPIIAIIVAAGRGTRFGGDIPKQYTRLAGIPVLRRTLDVFLSHPAITHVIPVIHADDSLAYAAAVGAIAPGRLCAPQIGGASRQESVLMGLRHASMICGPASGIVLIHDAARPFVSPALINRAIAAAMQHEAAVPAIMVTDSLVSIQDGARTGSVDRQTLRAVQTPQAFRLDVILKAHEQALARGDKDHTDDGSVAAAAGHPVHVFEGEAGNMKMTTQADMDLATLRIQHQTAMLSLPMVSRTATGFDVHALGEGNHVWLCGLKIPHTGSLIGHSDADVALHALTDALLGAMADGDIGRHFPPSDPQWRGAASDQFLAYAAQRLRGQNGIIDLLDVTIVCEAPKIGPHSEAMRRRVAEIAGIAVSAVSVKATTTERLGFNGRGEGISALASVTIRLPGVIN